MMKGKGSDLVLLAKYFYAYAISFKQSRAAVIDLKPMRSIDVIKFNDCYMIIYKENNFDSIEGIQ